jgi:putative exporter of polyketide antibiotics
MYITLGAVPGWSFMSYLVINSANMSIISVIAKNRPGLDEASHLSKVGTFEHVSETTYQACFP